MAPDQLSDHLGLAEAQEMLDQRVRVRHWTGMQFTAKVIGVCDQPSVIFETDEGERYTYAIGSIEAMIPARSQLPRWARRAR